MPALEMAQEAGVLVAWLKREGEPVVKGDPIMEIETDKVTVEIEAAASGILGGIRAHEGDRVPVGQTIAWILAPGEVPPTTPTATITGGRLPAAEKGDGRDRSVKPTGVASREASPLARRMAQEHGLDLSLVKSEGRRIERADVATYLKEHPAVTDPAPVATAPESSNAARVLASPKARRLAAEAGIDLRTLDGSGPDGAVIAADLPSVSTRLGPVAPAGKVTDVWRLMAERVTASWTSVPHFYLTREVDASNLVAWRTTSAGRMESATGIKPTYSDLLLKLIGIVLRKHPRLNAAWADGDISWNEHINVGLAVAIEEGLVVPVLHDADAAPLTDLVRLRKDLVERAQSRRLRPADVAGGTFTFTNLGMYNVDAFSAIINPPQAAILAAGRITERVVPQAGQIVIRPRMTLTLSCDHRVVDGARAGQFLDDLANLLEVPLSVLE